MGTRLIARGLTLDRDDPCLWNLSHPDDVLDIHRRDVAAGADALLTNTFGANRVWLARFGRAGDVPAILRRAVALAREAAGPDRFVVGCLGPTAIGDPAAYRDAAAVLVAEGVDALILETHTAEDARRGLERLRETFELPILVSIVGGWNGENSDSFPRGASAVGINCEPLEVVIERLGTLRSAIGGDLPFLSKPGGGLPGEPPTSPLAFAASVPALRASGVRLFGGCCGTTEAHVAALRSAIGTSILPKV